MDFIFKTFIFSPNPSASMGLCGYLEQQASSAYNMHNI